MAQAIEIRRVWEFTTEGGDVFDIVADGEDERYTIVVGDGDSLPVLWTTDIDDLCASLQTAKDWLTKQSEIISG